MKPPGVPKPRAAFRRIRSAYHFLFALFSAFVYGFPARHLAVIGVTGTNGKTTVVSLLHEILRAAGRSVGSVSSLRFTINGHEEPNLLKMTMPGRGALQRFLKRCRLAGCSYAVVEVTSEGIAQSRHRFIRFRAGVLTNVRPEHLESHGGFEEYRRAKLELFRRLQNDGFAVLNRDDPSADLFAAVTSAKIVWYSRRAIEFGGVGRPVRVIRVTPHEILFEIEDALFQLHFGGEFNFDNALAAVAAGLALGIPLSVQARALAGAKAVPGRLEYLATEPFAVVVDYAHTPDALEAVYRAVGGSIVAVLGAAGGGRDRWKRPELGKIAAQFARAVILTSEDPDDEEPAAIASEIQSGIPEERRGATRVVLDRRAAIREALHEAKPGDTVIITGMGSQPWFIAQGKKISWDERRVVREELTALGKEKVMTKVFSSLDFQIQTTASDGKHTPEECVEMAKQNGVMAIAITDHDTVAGVAEAMRVGEALGVHVIPGIELSIQEHGMHLLGLGIDPLNPQLVDSLRQAAGNRLTAARQMVENFQQGGFAIDWQDVLREAGSSAVVTRPHIVSAILKRPENRERLGGVTTKYDFFERFFQDDGPYYVRVSALSPRQAIDLVHAAGGVAVWSHPTIPDFTDDCRGLGEFLETLVASGLDGLELLNPAHRESDVECLESLAERHRLLVTAGSDFHERASASNAPWPRSAGAIGDYPRYGRDTSGMLERLEAAIAARRRRAPR